MHLIMRPYPAMTIQEWERPTSCKREYPIAGNHRTVLLIGCDNSFLVIGKLCDETSKEDTTVLCFYFDFAAGNKQSPRISSHP